MVEKDLPVSNVKAATVLIEGTERRKSCSLDVVSPHCWLPLAVGMLLLVLVELLFVGDEARHVVGDAVRVVVLAANIVSEVESGRACRFARWRIFRSTVRKVKSAVFTTFSSVCRFT